MKSNRGFTLIELMIALVIVAVILAIVPAYQNHLVRATRTATQQFMLDVAAREKEYFMGARTYLAVDAATAEDDFIALNRPVPAEISKYYTLTVAITSTPATFVISATPKAGTRQAGEANLTLNSMGEKVAELGGDKTPW